MSTKEEIGWSPCVATCDSSDGKGCGEMWMEWAGVARELCPGCGREACDGNVIVNDEGMPDVAKLNDESVLVVFREEAE